MEQVAGLLYRDLLNELKVSAFDLNYSLTLLFANRILARRSDPGFRQVVERCHVYRARDGQSIPIPHRLKLVNAGLDS